jgi:hypothetical protein
MIVVRTRPKITFYLRCQCFLQLRVNGRCHLARLATPLEHQWNGVLSVTDIQNILMCHRRHKVGRDDPVCIATYYGLYGLRIESRCWRYIPHASRSALGSTQPTIQWIPGLFRGSEAVGAWHWPPAPCRADVKERVELYLYYSSGPSWYVLGWTLPLL